MLGSAIIAAVSIMGIMATAASFYALSSGPKRPRLAALVLAAAILVAASPFVALGLGTSGHSWLRGLMSLGLVTFFAGVSLYLVTAVWAKQWASLASAVPMVGLAAWSFFFLGIFSTGVV